MTILVCGGREWPDYSSVLLSLFAHTFLIPVPAKEITVIDGAARGADNLGYAAARHMGYKTRRFHADWKTYGRAAGPIRNQEMLETGRLDMVLAFPMQDSRGAQHMIDIAREAGIRTVVYGEVS